MSLKIEQHEADGILLLGIEGSLVLGNSLADLQDTVNKNIDDGNLRQILNLKDVGHIDSSGLGMLVLLHTTVKNAGGAVKLLNLSKRQLELMILTKLTGVFEIFDDEQNAINSFYPGREMKHFDILEFVKSQEEETDAIEGPEGFGS